VRLNRSTRNAAASNWGKRLHVGGATKLGIRPLSGAHRRRQVSIAKLRADQRRVLNRVLADFASR